MRVTDEATRPATAGDAPAIEGLTAAVYVIPADAPEADGTLAWDETTMVLVTARAGGEQGIGWTYAAGAAAAVVTDVLAGVAAGRSALDVPAVAEAMARSLRNIGRAGVAAMALSAADIALWDLKARLLGLPLAGLLGRAMPSVPVYGSGGFTTYDEQQTRAQLTDWVERQRIPRVKIKIGQSWGADERRDLRRIELARTIIGPDTELYVDANGAYGSGQAVRVAHQMADYGVTWFEEPVSSQDLAGLAAVRRQVRPDVTAGEYSWSLADSARLIDAAAVDCLQLDVTRCGGITEFLRGAAVAARTTCRSRRTARRACTRTRASPSPTCGTSSTSTTTSASRACCSTACSARTGARSPRIRAGRGWGWRCGTRTPSSSARPDGQANRSTAITSSVPATA